jgi:hypothetical protein
MTNKEIRRGKLEKVIQKQVSEAFFVGQKQGLSIDSILENMLDTLSEIFTKEIMEISEKEKALSIIEQMKTKPFDQKEFKNFLIEIVSI